MIDAGTQRPTIPIRLTVNGQAVEAEIEPRVMLLDFLRDHLGLPAEGIVVYDEVQQLPYIGEDVLQRFGVDTRMVQLPPTHVKGVEIVDEGEYFAMWDRWGAKMRMPKA